MTDITGKEYIYGLAQDKNGAPYLFNIGELVRCKDCRFAMIRTEEEMNKPIKPQPILCEWFCIGVENDDYCSYGERREK